MKARLVVFWLVLVALVLVGARGPGAQAGTPARKEATGKVVIAVASDAECWNPLEGPCGRSLHYHDMIMDRLVVLDRDNNLAPGLATSWKIINDKTWEFKLRQGVKFTNGEPFNAAAVVFMFDPIVNPKGRTAPPTMRGNFRPLEKVQIVDEYTVRFLTKEPFPLLAQYMTYEPRAVPPKYYNQVGRDGFGLKPIGSGPYKLVEWVKNDHFTLEANPDYWGPKSQVKTLVFRPIPEETTRLAELLAGGVQIAEDISSDQVSELDKSKIAHKTTVGSLRTVELNLRPDEKLTNKALREAFEYATNIDTIIKDILGGYADKLGAGNPVSKYEFGFDPTIPEWPFDLEKAKQKVKESGYDGKPLELYFPEGDVPSIDRVAEALQAQWAVAGLKVKINKQEYGLWRTNWTNRTIPGDIFLKSSTAKAMDSDGRLVPNAMCNDPGKGLGRVSFFCNSEIDKVILQSQGTMDPKKREELLKKAWRMHRDHAHYIALYNPRFIFGVSNKLEWQPTVEGLFSCLVDAKWK